MPLRDTLSRLQEQQKRESQAISDRPALIAEWKSAVDELFIKIREYLGEYIREGSLSVKDRHVRLTEESLGTYEVDAMDIHAGPIIILVQPVGLMVIGAAGRVDMHRQGRPSEQHRVMLLRAPESKDNPSLAWFINYPSEATPQMVFKYQFPVATRKVTPLTKEALEEAVEFLLK